jgi:uncharacterized protein DUF2760
LELDGESVAAWLTAKRACHYIRFGVCVRSILITAPFRNSGAVPSLLEFNRLSRISLAFKSFFALLMSGKLPDDVVAALGLTRRIVTPPPASAAPPKGESAKSSPVAAKADPGEGALSLLGVLQREARLVDFLMEDIAPYSDEQVGAAVRSIHENSRKTLERLFDLAPVVDGVEGTVTNLASSGINAKDTTRVKLMGKVPADGKVESGILQHRGWMVNKAELPPVGAAEKARIIAPAEIEVE